MLLCRCGGSGTRFTFRPLVEGQFASLQSGLNWASSRSRRYGSTKVFGDWGRGFLRCPFPHFPRCDGVAADSLKERRTTAYIEVLTRFCL